MRARGINYDTGFINKGVSSREPFDLDVVRRELQIIHDELHCTAIRVTGGDPERLDSAARGAEISLLNHGFLPGDTLGERMELLNDGNSSATPFSCCSSTP